MAKTQTYTDDILISAVEKYAEVYSGKIMATKLAKWANKNIPGLEDVRDYHFMRPSVVKNSSTKRKTNGKRQCTQRIEDINKSRTITAELNTNTLLKSANIDEFLFLSQGEQRKSILDTRKLMDSLVSRDIYLARENKLIQAENERLKALENDYDAILKRLNDDVEFLNKKVNQIIEITNEEQIRNALAEIGITDDKFDLKKNTESLSVNIDKAFSISNAIKGKNATQGNKNITNSIIEDIEF